MLKTALFAVGSLLFLTNVAGVFLPLRNPAIYTEPGCKFPQDITLTAAELWGAIDSDAADRKAYVHHLNRAVNQGIAHYWREEGIDTYRLRVPAEENYLLWIASLVYPQVFRKYEFSHYRKAIERGVGLCSQHAIIIAGVLKDKTFPQRLSP